MNLNALKGVYLLGILYTSTIKISVLNYINLKIKFSEVLHKTIFNVELYNLKKVF